MAKKTGRNLEVSELPKLGEPPSPKRRKRADLRRLDNLPILPSPPQNTPLVQSTRFPPGKHNK